MFKLLIVEDERIAREAIRDTIDWRQWGFSDIKDARNGAEGLALVSSEKPDLVITDILMPRMNGLEFARQVHQLEPKCRIIILSAYQNPEYVHSAFQTGAIDYLLKPVKQDELIEAVGRAVRELVIDLSQAPDSENKGAAIHGSLNGIREQILYLFLSGNLYARELWHTYHHLFEASASPVRNYALIRIITGNAPSDDGAGVDELENCLNEHDEKSVLASLDYAQPIRFREREIVCVIGVDSDQPTKDDLAREMELEIMQTISEFGLEDTKVFRTGWADNLLEIGDLFKQSNVKSGYSELRTGWGPQVSAREEQLSARVSEIIDEHFLDDKVSIKEIAASLSCTSAYLCMSFKKARGLTINEYLNLARVKEAKHLLEASDMKLIDVAYEAGFSSANYFAKVFKKYENCTPSEYRERNK